MKEKKKTRRRKRRDIYILIEYSGQRSVSRRRESVAIGLGKYAQKEEVIAATFFFLVCSKGKPVTQDFFLFFFYFYFFPVSFLWDYRRRETDIDNKRTFALIFFFKKIEYSRSGSVFFSNNYFVSYFIFLTN